MREKIGKCIRKYGDIAYEPLLEEKNCGETWRTIYDLQMFFQSIYLTLLEFDDLKREDLKDISNCIKIFLEYDSYKNSYKIVYCPSNTAHYASDPYYLRLCLIVFALRKDKQPLIKSFMKACYLRANTYRLSDSELEQLKDLTLEGWDDEVLELYKKYSLAETKDTLRLRQQCKKVKNLVEKDPNQY